MFLRIILLGFLIFTISSCRDSVSILNNEPVKSNLTLIKKFSVKIDDIKISPFFPNIITILPQNISYDYGKNFHPINALKNRGFFVFSKRKSDYLYYCETNYIEATINISSDLGQNWNTVKMGFSEASISDLETSRKTNLVYAIYNFSDFMGGNGDLIVSTDNGLTWSDTLTLFWIEYQRLRNGRFPFHLLDINLCERDNTDILTVSDANKGIFISKDLGKSWLFFHQDILFIKHKLSLKSQFGAAICKNNYLDNTFLVITNDDFNTISQISQEKLFNIQPVDIIINEQNNLIVLGYSLTSDTSMILLSKDNGDSFTKLIEMKGKITSLDYDSINNWIYFTKSTDYEGELYRYSLSTVY